MAKVSQVNRNMKRERMAARDKTKRAALKSVIMDRDSAVEERFDASLKLAQLPRNGAAVRIKLRCAADRPGEGELPQVQAVPDRAAGPGECSGQIPGHGQGELVRERPRMSMSDPLGDMLTRIRNAQRARHAACVAPASKLRANVLDALKREGLHPRVLRRGAAAKAWASCASS